MVFSPQLVHSTRSLVLFTPQETTTNPRTFGTESTTSTRRRCQSLSLNSDSIGSMGSSRTPQGQLPRTKQPLAVRIRIDPSSSVQETQVRLETRFAEQTASGQLSVTLHSTRAFHLVTPSPSLSRTTARFMSCSPSLLNLIPDGQVLQISVGTVRPNLTKTRTWGYRLTRQTDSAKFPVGQTL